MDSRWNAYVTWQEHTVNVLYLKKKLFAFRKSTSPLCPFCKLSDETVLHLFYECNIILNLWNELVLFFENEFTLFDLTPQAAFIGFLNVDSELLFIQNHLLLIFKIYVYNSRKSESLRKKCLIREITKVKKHRGKNFIKQWKKACYIQEKMATSWKCLEDQNFLTFDLIQPYKSGGGVGLRRGSRQKGLVFINLTNG